MFKIEFRTSGLDNSRFEILDILQKIADRVDGDFTGGPVRDINGNTIGSWSLTED